MADRVFMPRALDSNGDIVTDATAYFYELGTTTPLIVYSDSDGLTPLGISTNGYADGTFAGVFTTEPIRMDIKTAAGVSLPGFPSDGWYVVPANGVGAGTITFEPQEGNTATDVQTAINNLSALWFAVTDYGKSLIAAADAAAARLVLGLGTASTTDATAYATAAQGTLADAALPAASLPIKAWVSFDGNPTVSINRNSGFASVTRISAGIYECTLSAAMADTNYGVLATAGDAATTRLAAHYYVISTTVFRVYVINHGNGIFSDADFVTATALY